MSYTGFTSDVVAVNTHFLRVQLTPSLVHHSVNKHRKIYGLTFAGLRCHGLKTVTNSITVFVAVTVKPGEDSVLTASTVIANTDNAC